MKKFKLNKNEFPILLLVFLVFVPHFINATFYDYRNFQKFDNLILLLRLFLIMYIMFRRKDKHKKFSNKSNNKIIISVFLFFIWSILVSFIRYFNYKVSISFVLKDFLMMFLDQIFVCTLFLYPLKPIDSREMSKKLYNLLVFVSTGAILFNLVLKYDEFIKFKKSDFPQTLNFRSFFINRNYFGFLMFISIVLLVFKNYKKKKSNKFQFFLLIIHFVFLLLSMSRNSMMALTMFLLLLLLLKNKNFLIENQRFLFIVFLSFIFIGFILIKNSTLLRNILRLDNLLSDRLGIWKSTINIFKMHPLWGLGGFRLREILSIEYGKAIQPHNLWIYSLSSLGVIGFILFLYQLKQVIVKIFKSIEENRISIYFISFILTLFVYSMFENIPLFGFSLYPTLISTSIYVIVND